MRLFRAFRLLRCYREIPVHSVSMLPRCYPDLSSEETMSARRITKRTVDALQSRGSEFTVWDDTVTGLACGCGGPCEVLRGYFVAFAAVTGRWTLLKPIPRTGMAMGGAGSAGGRPSPAGLALVWSSPNSGPSLSEPASEMGPRGDMPTIMFLSLVPSRPRARHR